MAIEAIDARHEALLSLHRAQLAIEAGCMHQAETHAMSAVAWMRNVTQERHLEDTPEAEPAWTYRP